MDHRILVVEDLPDCCRWMMDIAHQAFGAATVMDAASLAEGLVLLEHNRFDVVLVDLGLPDGSGLTIIQHIKENHPYTVPIVISIHDDAEHIFPAIRAGAQGYLLKDQPKHVLAEKLLGFMKGEPPLSPSIARMMLSHFSSERTENEMESLSLTPREEEVLVLVSRGLSRGEIAETLNLSKHTISRYIKDLYKKIGVNSRAEAAVLACQIGLIRVN